MSEQPNWFATVEGRQYVIREVQPGDPGWRELPTAPVEIED